jgi:hypothetical protein
MKPKDFYVSLKRLTSIYPDLDRMITDNPAMTDHWRHEFEEFEARDFSEGIRRCINASMKYPTIDRLKRFVEDSARDRRRARYEERTANSGDIDLRFLADGKIPVDDIVLAKICMSIAQSKLRGFGSMMAPGERDQERIATSHRATAEQCRSLAVEYPDVAKELIELATFFDDRAENLYPGDDMPGERVRDFRMAAANDDRD